MRHPLPSVCAQSCDASLGSGCCLPPPPPPWEASSGPERGIARPCTDKWQRVARLQNNIYCKTNIWSSQKKAMIRTFEKEIRSRKRTHFLCTLPKSGDFISYNMVTCASHAICVHVVIGYGGGGDFFLKVKRLTPTCIGTVYLDLSGGYGDLCDAL